MGREGVEHIVCPIGVYTLFYDSPCLWTLENRTYYTKVPSTPEGLERLRSHLLAYQGKAKGTSVRLTGLFVSKNRKGLAVGTMRASDMPALIEKIKEANGKKLGLTFFLWKNDRQGPAFSISVDVERPREQQSRPAPSRKPIEADDLFGPEPEAADDPFKD